MSKNIEATLDTNFMIQYKNDINNIIDDIKEKYNTVIFNIVVEEIKGQKVRMTKRDYKDIIDKINKTSLNNDWLKIEDNTDIEKTIEKQEKALDKWMSLVFGKSIININMSELMESLLNMAKYKEPPFNDADDASDKGFKDALLYLSMIKHYTQISDIKKVYLLTNDKGFLNKKDSLEEIFLKQTNKQLKIIESDNKDKFYKELDIELIYENENVISDKVFPNDKDIEYNLEEIKKSFLEITKKIFDNKQFSIYNELNDDNMREIFENINEKIDDFTFVEKVELLGLINNAETYSKVWVEVDDIKELLNQYNKISSNNKLENAFLQALKIKINEHYVELPF